MIWLGSHRGFLSDWVTQRWVQLTGRRLDLRDHSWLAGPVGQTTGIAPGYFDALAAQEGLTINRGSSSYGIIPAFNSLGDETLDVNSVHPTVVHFYEQTSAYELDAWAEWCGVFRPFGWLLAVLFSRRLQQLNVPLSGLDTSDPYPLFV